METGDSQEEKLKDFMSDSQKANSKNITHIIIVAMVTLKDVFSRLRNRIVLHHRAIVFIL